jgi:ABC-type Fe3+ transport system substrate-binding protein
MPDYTSKVATVFDPEDYSDKCIRGLPKVWLLPSIAGYRWVMTWNGAKGEAWRVQSGVAAEVARQTQGGNSAQAETVKGGEGGTNGLGCY